MRVSEQWLREWVDPGLTTQELASALTMAGLEVDAVEPAAPPLRGVVVGEIVACAPHPAGDHLQICQVDAGGDGPPVEVVCAAPNARLGLCAPLALEGAEIAEGRRVEAATVRGVVSHGMLCSAAELGLGDDHSGLLELPSDLPPGTDLYIALGLEDTVFEIDLTPNRADCLGMIGVAREVAAITEAPLNVQRPPAVGAGCEDRVAVELAAAPDCPHYCGRVIRTINARAETPLWMRERLRRAGIRCVSAVVDITNYVLLEFGQPMHAFDLGRLAPPVVVRRARSGESLTLLGGESVALDEEVLVITDRSGPIAFAGVMGGASTAVSDETRDVFLEAAFFNPATVAGRARRFGLHTDASHRFERGVDFAIARHACERATSLIIEICGGVPGPLQETSELSELPQRAPITLRRERLEGLLGWSLEPATVSAMLKRLGTEPEETPFGWRAQPPSWRFDLAREVDLIEEIARLYGYDAIPEHPLQAPLHVASAPEQQLGSEDLRQTLVERGYFEAITYAFVDPALQQRLDPECPPLSLANPLSSELAVMRTSLWPGLLKAMQHNQHRQHERVRLFEHGCVFRGSLDQLQQPAMLAGACCGPFYPEQWDGSRRGVDFYDLKADLEALIARTGAASEFTFQGARHPALHPGQCARIERAGRPVGWLGTLHPEHAAALELQGQPVLFEIALEALSEAELPAFRPISRYPAIRRDLALVVADTVPAGELLKAAQAAAGSLAVDAVLFDVYRGQGVPEGSKSIAMGLILQDYSRTLRDEDVEQAMRCVVDCLQSAYQASLRGE
ncbi:phenylalanine--tRNA ligase subunit beta [Halorhodospira abdelmalekii]|uniref:phenylalanine--tRNA ligase subunit beta n=1 Tax=Halorhodospira abdelmalekii TaxID=421629 RepID=UPI0019062155|nr:phenylalanine--tRNA ligase subunit beta [Halorhodospira abdelmalekii]MBK1734440.1 phenylalanine--tRNA ligase subunit beta [Halorhodospira abdelmalekii]